MEHRHTSQLFQNAIEKEGKPPTISKFEITGRGGRNITPRRKTAISLLIRE